MGQRWLPAVSFADIDSCWQVVGLGAGLDDISGRQREAGHHTARASVSRNGGRKRGTNDDGDSGYEDIASRTGEARHG